MSQKFNTIYISELNSQKFRVVNNWGGVMSRSKYKKFIEVKKDAPIYAKRIAIIMNEKGWSQKDLSERCNGEISVSEGTITGWLQGSNGKYTEPRINALNEVAKVLGVSLDFLLDNSDVKSPDTTIQAVGKYTGLSDKAIEMLKYLNDRKNVRSYIDLLSCIISSSNFEYLLGLLEGYISPNGENISAQFSMSRADINYKDLCIFTANNALRSILDEAGEEFLKQYKTTDIRLEEYYDEKLKSKGRC